MSVVSRQRTWFEKVWVPAARDSLRRRRHMVGSRWWPLRVLFARAVACRTQEPMRSPHGGYGWTCQRHRWHGGAHRYRNYVWFTESEHARFDPMPTNGHSAVTW